MPNEYEIQRFRGSLALVYYDTAGTRHRHTLGTKDPVEADRIAPAIYTELTRPKSKSVEVLWNAYVIDMAGRQIVERMKYSWIALKGRFASIEGDAITVADCDAHIEERRKSGISDGTLHTELGHLRNVLVWSAKHKHISAAPFIKRPSAPKPKEDYLTREQLRAFLAATIFPHVRLAVVLLYTTAARSSALLGLVWARCDFERKLIDLRDPTINRPHKGRAIVPMNQMAEKALRAAKEYALSDYVIERGGVRIKSLRKGITLAGNRVGLKVHPHMIRHSAAVHMAEDDVSMEQIAQFLGHSSVETTRRIYARFSPSFLQKAAASLNIEDLPRSA